MQRNTLLKLFLVQALLLLVPAPGSSQKPAEPAPSVEPALPAAGGLPPIPEGFRAEGPREANGRQAFLAYVRAVRDLTPAEGASAEARATLDRYLESPGKFRLGTGPGADAFIALVQRFAERRLLEPTIATTIGLISSPTYRRVLDPDEVDPAFEEALSGLFSYLSKTVAELNAAQPEALPLELIDWSGPKEEGPPARVIGVRVGKGPRRFAIVTHVDTVPPIHEDWRPFEGRLEVVEHRGAQRLFIRGRGSIDDKGPTAVALHVLDVIRAVWSGTPLLEEFSFEVLADTSEETGRSMEAYLEAVGAPEAGNVLDAAWSIVAEKGSERPTFRVASAGAATPAGLHLVSLSTPEGPTNQIPDRAVARFAVGTSDPAAARELLAAQLAEYLRGDDGRARLELAAEGPELTVTGIGSGAAHGSAPDVNKAGGHNPLACLSAFVAHLHRGGHLAPNDRLSLPLFLAWGFGHNVYGEDHPEELRATDDVFKDGTTYTLTRLSTGPEGMAARIDIRYALPHHGKVWDGRSFGTLEGDSRFRGLFQKLLDEFNATLPAGAPPVTFETRTGVGPDLKDRDSPVFRALLASYQAVMGEPSPLLAIGGGTDAKGVPTLFACGPNFSKNLVDIFAPPVNYHGVDEAAPVEDLTRSGRILVLWLSLVGTEPPR